jgi:VirE N-terminal domain/Primase C terminal 2 (PriCT-2)/Protein of unknown function (DUF3987)
MNILDAPVSLFPRVTAQTPQDNPPLRVVLAQIRDGTYALEIATLRSRKPYLSEKAYAAEKAKLRCFTPCCTIKTRDHLAPLSDRLTSVTGQVHFDFDHLPDLEATRAQLLREPALVFCFVGPSGDGLKASVAAAGIVDGATYKYVWHQVAQVLEARYPGLEASRDDNVSSLVSLCFVSHDPDLFMNDAAVPIEVEPYEAPEPAPAPKEREGPSFAVVASALAYIPNKNVHYDVWFKVGAALHSTGQPWARSLFDGWSAQSPKYDPKKQQTTWVSLKTTGNVQIDWVFGMARKAGWQDPGVDEGINVVNSSEKVESGNPHEIRPKTVISLTSLTSYPWPVLAPEALYGLAGDYVRAIAPHTESDQAALLSQFLTVFGCLIGRHRFMTLDGVRHYTNLFTVIAGLTSRARKGTSYAHIEAQMHTADPSWGLANHIKGCGSGEGLIFAVRDERVGQEPIKATTGEKKGQITGYQEVILDPGVDDKRALYQTGEFSGLLKVAAREGNTLSEVLRDAWDTGYLRNATKGHPLQAHGAHISVIGHITIDELQKLLTSTDMANGFANRFLWICAKRSKLLPRGGNLQKVDFRSLRERLHCAIVHGTFSGEMAFGTTAEASWDAVYGMLAEDRVGLANTLLARAEPQVARLAMLYAILDQSSTIAVEHLNAALALWEYTEDSAAYIFGEAIGDETADTIVKALHQAGSAGLSKNALLKEVFQRNVPAAEITRALHLLEKLGRIVTTTRPPEGGIGRPSTHYILQPYDLNDVNDITHGRYLAASNDAAKSAGLTSFEHPDNYDLSPQNGSEPPVDPPFVPDVTGVPPEGPAPDVPENGDEILVDDSLREPGDEDDFESGVIL